MKKSRRLAGVLIFSAICLILYCVVFFAECFLENKQEKKTYEKIRDMCIQADFSDDRGEASDSESDTGKQKTKTNADDKKIKDGEKGIPRESFGISWEKLRKISPEIIGWIEVYGADISYPILQGTDDEYYLHHAPDGTESPFGSIFLGADHKEDFMDSHSLVYGHNMEGGMMFANLNKYDATEFCRKCPTFSVITPERKFTYEIFSVEQAEPGSACYVYGYEKTSGAYKQQLDCLKANSVYDIEVSLEKKGRVVTLITCNSRLDAEVRTAIHGICRNIEIAGKER